MEFGGSNCLINFLSFGLGSQGCNCSMSYVPDFEMNKSLRD